MYVFFMYSIVSFYIIRQYTTMMTLVTLCLTSVIIVV